MSLSPPRPDERAEAERAAVWGVVEALRVRGLELQAELAETRGLLWEALEAKDEELAGLLMELEKAKVGG